jgi:hypothetical protein
MKGYRQMDKKRSEKSNWAWLPAAMPGVSRLMAEKRLTYGDAHVNECWQRGVIQRQPGWFFAREGALSVGTPWDEPAMANFAALQVTATQALVCVREPGAANGT